MATLNGNNAYLTVNSVDLAAYFVNIEFEQSVEAVDTTAGAGATYMERQAGLKDIKGKITIVYETTAVTTHIQTLAAGSTYTVVYGPESNTAGKPKHEQSFLFTKLSGPKQDVAKKLLTWEADIEGAAAPVTDIYAGGTF